MHDDLEGDALGGGDAPEVMQVARCTSRADWSSLYWIVGSLDEM